MRVISKSRLRQFWESAKGRNADGPLRAWYTHVNSRSTSWSNWGDVTRDFATASLVGNCVVFNVGGNKFRLIVRILYPSQKVFILKVMTHKEYDEAKWQAECGCFAPPSSKSTSRSTDPGKSGQRGE